MNHQQRAERDIINPPPLRLKIGAVGRIEPELVAKADAAIARISSFFGPWLVEEIQLLTAARCEIRDYGYNAETAELLNNRAHELKSLGTTYGFPVITAIADSLCRLVDEPETRMAAPLYLIDAHIDAIAAAARDNIRDCDHPVGRALTHALNALVRANLSKLRPAPGEARRNADAR